MGVGKSCPRPKDRVKWPLSWKNSGDVGFDTGSVVEVTKRETDLLYDEFVVYEESQIVIRYLVRVEFIMQRGELLGSAPTS